MKNTHRKIDILDPDRWYISYGKKRKHYTQLHSSIWSDADFLSLKNDTKVLFLWLLNASLRVNKPSLSVCLESAKVTLRVSLGVIKHSLNELESFNIIYLESKLRASIEEKKIEENKREENKIEKSHSQVANYTHDDIIQLWNDLAGKKQGYFKGNRLIATREENEELQKIMDIYPEISSWENAIKNILNSDTTNGKAINWKATLPWLCEYKNFKKYANASTIEVKSYEVPDELLKPEFQQLR